MKYCAYKNWFLCIICLYVIAKTYTEIENTYSYATRQAAMATLEMMYPGLGSDEGVLSEVRGVYTPLGGVCIRYWWYPTPKFLIGSAQIARVVLEACGDI